MPNPSDDDLQAQFEFVYHPRQQGSRSHAMREHWKQRRLAQREKKKNAADGRGRGRWQTGPKLPDADLDLPPPSSLSIINLAPIQLSALPHRLLHHWVTAYAPSILGQQPRSEFPTASMMLLNISSANAVSYNMALAQSAAHVAHLRGCNVPNEALMFKQGAIKVLREWIEDPLLAYTDATANALFQLMTYERYWGTEAEWRLHRDGLLQIVKARRRNGGSEQDRQWMMFISAMQAPSWLSTSNDVRSILNELCPETTHDFGHASHDENYHTEPGIALYLWLLSTYQDLRTFKYLPCETISRFRRVAGAAKALYKETRMQARRPPLDRPCDANEFKRLSCVLLIGILAYQASLPHKIDTIPPACPPDTATVTEPLRLAQLDAFLQRHHGSAELPAPDLYSLLFNEFLDELDDQKTAEYALTLASCIRRMTGKMRHEMERAILVVLLRDEADIAL